MATYVSKRERRRRLVVAVATAGVLAAGAGYGVGRTSVPTVRERVASVRDQADNLATRVSALTIEYEQVLSGGGDSVAAGVTRPLTDIERELDQLLKGADWVGATEAARVRGLVADVGASADARVDVAAYEQVTAAASAALRDLAGSP